MIQHPVAVLAVLLGVLALLFYGNRVPFVQKIFKVIPLLVWCYFLPGLLSNLGILPFDSPTYTFIKKWLLPCSLFLLTLSVDIPAIVHLGRKTLYLFLAATATIVFGGPLAYLCVGPFLSNSMGEQMWKGLAALSGSWIGGGANFVAIGESVGASDLTMAKMVIVDVGVISVWMAMLFYFAGREKTMDDKIGADRSGIDELIKKVENYHAEVLRPTTLPDLLAILALAFGSTAIVAWFAGFLPDIGTVVKGFTWIVILITAVSVAFSFTPLRRLDGAGSGAVGSVFLYLLVATIGARSNVSGAVDIPGLILIGALWMLFHAGILLLLRRLLKAPIFLLAVGSQANVGGAASAPVVASAFHPSLAPVGVLLAVGGYVLGTYCGILCAILLEQVHYLIH